MSEQNINIPNEYRPLSPWGYIGYNILFNIPIVGLVLLIVFALDNNYIARRNYSRSYLIVMLIGILISVIAFIICLALGLLSTYSLN